MGEKRGLAGIPASNLRNQKGDLRIDALLLRAAELERSRGAVCRTRFVGARDTQLDPHDRFSSGTPIGAANRRDVAIVAPDRHPEMTLVGPASMGRVEAAPARS